MRIARAAQMPDDRQPTWEFIGQPSAQLLDLVAELLLSSADCELCQAAPAEHFIDQHPQRAGRHCCSSCFESLTNQDQDGA